MKFVATLFVYFMACSAFAAGPATDASGHCSSQLMKDLLDINSAGKSMLEKMTRELVDLVKRDAPQAEATARLNGIVKEFGDQLNAFRGTYGEFSCEIGYSGQTLTSQEIYKSHDEMNAAIAKMSQPQVAKDGECGAEFKADYLAMTAELKPLAKAMVEVLPELARKGANGEDITAEKTFVRSGARMSLSLVKTLRTKHAGVFSCSLVTAEGETLVIESADIDAQIQTLEQNIQSMN